MLPLITKHHFRVSEEFLQWAHEILAEGEKPIVASRAADAEIDVAGLGGTLRPFQKAGVAYALGHPRTFIADGMGLGKTIQALALLQAANTYPALVICPAVVKLNWAKESRHWLPKRRTCILGYDAPDYTADIFIINYDRITLREPKRSPVPAVRTRGRARPSEKEKELIASPLLQPLDGRIKCLVCDEAHYVKDPNAQRSKMVKRLASGCDRVLLLTGTPILNRPRELIHPLQVLGVLTSVFGGYWAFRGAYCDPIENGPLWDRRHQVRVTEKPQPETPSELLPS